MYCPVVVVASAAAATTFGSLADLESNKIFLMTHCQPVDKESGDRTEIYNFKIS
jgi:hypothetical protein